MKVVITGLGCWTAFGRGVEASFDALRAGRSAIDGPGPFPGAGPVAAVPGGPHLGSALAEAVVRDALGGRSPEGVGLVGGTTAGDMVRGELEYARWRAGEVGTDGLLWSQLADRPAQRVARAVGIDGPRLSVSTACSSGAVAVGIAADWVRRGRAPAVVAFGVDALCGMTVHGFGSLQSVSASPARPFDAGRDGLSLGEGAAAVLLEPLAAALARGATPLAEVAGWGTSSDAHHMTAPDPEGAGAEAAIRGAGTDGVDWVCAHGTATPLNDQMEEAVLQRVLPGVPYSSLKGAVGHTLGAAGAIELVLAVAALRRGWLLPNVGGVAEPGASVVRRARRAPLRGVLSVNFAFGGHNAAVRLLAAPC